MGKSLTLSRGELINETAFGRVCKASESLHWTVTEDGRDIVINGHWIIDADLSEKARSVLFSIFGRVPEPGVWYNARKFGRGYTIVETSPVQFEKFFTDAGDAYTYDTRLTYTLSDARTVRLYSAPESCVIAIASAYDDMIVARDGLSAGKSSSGIKFDNGRERAFILPVRVTDDPFAFLNK